MGKLVRLCASRGRRGGDASGAVHSVIARPASGLLCIPAPLICPMQWFALRLRNISVSVSRLVPGGEEDVRVRF